MVRVIVHFSLTWNKSLIKSFTEIKKTMKNTFLIIWAIRQWVPYKSSYKLESDLLWWIEITAVQNDWILVCNSSEGISLCYFAFVVCILFVLSISIQFSSNLGWMCLWVYCRIPFFLGVLLLLFPVSLKDPSLPIALHLSHSQLAHSWPSCLQLGFVCYHVMSWYF